MNSPNHQDILRRAELFNEIVDLVESASKAQQVLDHPPLVSHNSTRKLYPPAFLIVHHRLVCNGASIDLSRRPIVLNLIRMFIDVGFRPLSREEILIGLYGHVDPGSSTLRFRESMLNNVVKVISRARVILTTNFSGIGADIDWLVYDHCHKVWHLYRPGGI